MLQKGNAMNQFIVRYGEMLSGTLAGFDRLVFRGTNGLNHPAGMKGYLWAHDLGLKDFGEHAQQISRRVKQAALAGLEAAGRPIKYLNSGKDNKQQLAAEIAARDGIRNGPICALTAVELCRSYAIVGEQGRLRLEPSWRKCLFIYQYWMHPLFGFMSVRLQTWFPFPIHIYLNGREWLARQMDHAGMRYRRHDNCFTWVEDFVKAQQLMDEQRKVNWAEQFDGMREHIHPVFSEICVKYPLAYYWTCSESEWAMDLVFRDAAQLRQLYPQLVHLGMVSFSSPDVLRFMGKKVTRHGTAMGSTELPVTTDLKVRTQGVRIKHRLGPNSIKLYDKAYDELGAVLRSEITINVPKYFRVFRGTDDPNSEPAWRPLRHGTVDMDRRAEVSQKALDRYCSALAAVDDSTTLEQLTATIERRVRWHGQSMRALHPFDPQDHALLQAINRGEFALIGLRNRDLQSLLYDKPAKNKAEQRRRSAAISRKLRLLRAHGLIHKLPHTHRYKVSENGRLILNAILSAHRATIRQFMASATAA
jgi:hypothetical protein